MLIFTENRHMVCGLLNGFGAVLLMTLQYLNCSQVLLLLKSGVSISATKRFYSNVTIRRLLQEGQLSVTGESMCTKYWLTA